MLMNDLFDRYQSECIPALSRMFATVDLHNLMHFLRLRMHRPRPVRNPGVRRSVTRDCSQRRPRDHAGV
jgi:hypothetical protein